MLQGGNGARRWRGNSGNGMEWKSCFVFSLLRDGRNGREAGMEALRVSS